MCFSYVDSSTTYRAASHDNRCHMYQGLTLFHIPYWTKVYSIFSSFPSLVKSRSESVLRTCTEKSFLRKRHISGLKKSLRACLFFLCYDNPPDTFLYNAMHTAKPLRFTLIYFTLRPIWTNTFCPSSYRYGPPGFRNWLSMAWINPWLRESSTAFNLWSPGTFVIIHSCHSTRGTNFCFTK